MKADNNSPRFVKSLGLDIIIRPDGQAVLIELQSHFGRRGLIHLFPEASRLYRRTILRLRRDCGPSTAVNDGLRRICADKIRTWRMCARHQPSSLPYHRWGPAVERWLKVLTSDFVIAKPPRGSCGRGILIFDRRSMNCASIPGPLPGSILLQEYVKSRPHPDRDGQPRIGCIRHIVIIHCDGESLGFTHLPPYWRVAPAPFTRQPAREAFTANISAGASPAAVSKPDTEAVRTMTETVGRDLLRQILDQPDLPARPSAYLSPE